MAMAKAAQVGFVKPMEALAVRKLPTGKNWSYELKIDGHRVQAISRAGQASILSRRQSSYTVQFPSVARALKGLPDGTVIDGELAALDDAGRPRMGLLQNHRTNDAPIVYFPFDIMFHRGEDLTKKTLEERRAILQRACPESDLVLRSTVMETAAAIIAFVAAHELEGVIAKRIDSCYESGRRTGSWQKMRMNLGQEFVVGGYIPSELGVTLHLNQRLLI